MKEPNANSLGDEDELVLLDEQSDEELEALFDNEFECGGEVDNELEDVGEAEVDDKLEG